MIELDNRFVRPKSISKLLARDYLAGGFEEHSQNLERLLLEPDPASLFAQFAPSKIQLK